MSNKENDIFNESLKETQEQQAVCIHDWDIEDYTNSTGGDAFEFCSKCGIKSGK